MLFVLEAGGRLVGVLGLGWEEDLGDLRRTAWESRFEKKERKAGMGKRSREDAVVGEDGVWPGHLLKAANQTDAQSTRRPTTGPGRRIPIISSTRFTVTQGHPDYSLHCPQRL